MIHINRFIDKIKAVESCKKLNTSANFPMTVQEAKDLHADITKLLLVLSELQQQQHQKTDQASDDVINIEISGGSWD